MKKSKKELIEVVKECLDPDVFMGIDCLENVVIHDDLETVSITFKFIEVPEDNYIGLNGY